jgi:DNA-binding PadR family transcriptional regulator
VLVLLHQHGESHGYSLLSGLEQFGFNSMRIDPSLVYRSLREMEEMGLVSSEWSDDESQGPQRRVYQITQEGDGYLSEWINDLRKTREEIDNLISTYQSQQQTQDPTQPKHISGDE